MSLDIIISFYNPPENWEKLVFNKFEELRKSFSGCKTSLIIVNDGSDKKGYDQEVNFLKNKIRNFNYIAYEKNKGKGFALRQGVAVAKSQFQIITDIDFPYKKNSVLSVFKALNGGYDVVIGIRGEDYYIKKPLFRAWLSKGFRKLVKYVLKLNASDTQCGLKGFSQKGKQAFLSTKIKTFLFDVEFLLISENQQLTIREEPVSARKNIILTNFKARVLFTELYNLFFLCVGLFRRG